ncbi:MAG: MarR family transcriptional regulator [Eubacteriales bacterium]|nr:MarR family transcriptional regulator [Eubacteriales bacterium]
MNRLTLMEQYLAEKHNTAILHEHYLNTVREYAPGTNLYMREVHFLVAADPEQPISISELAERLEVTLGAVSQMATKLEKKGLVLRSPDPNDRRRTMVSLTEAGIRLYQEHMEYDKKSVNALSEIFQEFSEEEIKRLIRAEELFRQALRTANNK